MPCVSIHFLIPFTRHNAFADELVIRKVRGLTLLKGMTFWWLKTKKIRNILLYWENYGCEAWRNLYTYLETYHCRVAVVGGHGETYMGTGTLMVVGVAVVGKSRETCTWTRRPMAAGGAVVARTRETYTCTRRPMFAGVWILNVNWQQWLFAQVV